MKQPPFWLRLRKAVKDLRGTSSPRASATTSPSSKWIESGHAARRLSSDSHRDRCAQPGNDALGRADDGQRRQHCTEGQDDGNRRCRTRPGFPASHRQSGDRELANGRAGLQAAAASVLEHWIVRRFSGGRRSLFDTGLSLAGGSAGLWAGEESGLIVLGALAPDSGFPSKRDDTAPEGATDLSPALQRWVGLENYPESRQGRQMDKGASAPP